MVLSDLDEESLQKLHSWLLGLGIDVVRIGEELTLPSPFKERDKRQHGAPPGYVDAARRLSVTIRQRQIVWQCWYTKGKTGKPFGGRSAWALSVRTGQSQAAIMAMLGLYYDEKVAQAETLMDKIAAITAGGIKPRKSAVFDHGTPFDAPAAPPEPPKATTRLAAYPPVTNSLSRLYAGSWVTGVAERWVAERGIPREIADPYGLLWDADEEKILLPFWSKEGVLEYYQWYDHDARKYRFPRKLEGCVGHKELIFGELQFACKRDSIPLILSEGIWDAVTLCGCAIAGSVLTDEQVRRIVSLSPNMVIMALDNDTAGVHGAEPSARRLKSVLTIPVVSVYPPAEHKDWNKIAERCGHAAAIQCFTERVRTAQMGDPIVAKVQQILQ